MFSTWGTFTWQITYLYQHHLVDACLEDATKLVVLAGAMEQEPRVYLQDGRCGIGMYVGQKVSEERYHIHRRYQGGPSLVSLPLGAHYVMLAGTTAAVP